MLLVGNSGKDTNSCNGGVASPTRSAAVSKLGSSTANRTKAAAAGQHRGKEVVLAKVSGLLPNICPLKYV